MPTTSPLFDIQFDGLKQLQAHFGYVHVLIEKNLRVAVQKTVLWGAGEIARETPVDTGLLRASIGGMVIDTSAGGQGAAQGRRQSLTQIDGLTGVIGTAVKYAIHQEFGFTATGPKKLTRKQLRFLFATGILRSQKSSGGKAIVRPGTVTVLKWGKFRKGKGGLKVGKIVGSETHMGIHKSINRRAGIRSHVKGRGFFRRNIPAIRQYFFAQCEQAIGLALLGKEMQVTY